MTPAQALERLLPYSQHLAYCKSRETGRPNRTCNCNLSDAVQAAYEALSDAEPLVGPGRAEPDTVTHG